MAYVETYKLGSGAKKYRTVWRAPNGKKRSKSFGRMKDANRYRLEVERKAELGELYEAAPETFGAFLSGWLVRYRQRVRASSYHRTLEVLKHMESFADTPIPKLVASDVEDYFLALGRTAPRQAELGLQTLKKVLKDARARGQTVPEAIFNVKPARRERREMRFLSWDQVEELAANTVEPYGNLVQLAALTGLRQGELFALRDSNLDLEAGTITVTHTLYQGEYLPPKTGAARRRVDLTPTALRLLKEQLLARVPNGDSLVFPSPEGRPLNDDNFRSRVYTPACKRTGLGGLRFHDLRHTYAALMVRAGANPKYLQAQMGHTSIRVTLDDYGHLFPDANRSVLVALETLVGGEPASAVAG